MRELVIGGGRENDGKGEFLTEQVNPCIELRNVHQDVRLQLDALIGLKIPAHGDLVGGRAIEKFPGHVRDAALRGGLKIGKARKLRGQIRRRLRFGGGCRHAGAGLFRVRERVSHGGQARSGEHGCA